MRTAPAARRAAALVLAALLLAGCGGTGEGGDPSASPAPTMSGMSGMPGASSPGESAGAGEPTAEAGIVISDFTFHVPDSVPAGSELTVRNDDSVGHTVTSDEEGIFDVAVGPGEVVTLAAPADLGEYPFHCIPHPFMTSTLVVR